VIVRPPQFQFESLNPQLHRVVFAFSMFCTGQCCLQTFLEVGI
jgi:hypothetical protein